MVRTDIGHGSGSADAPTNAMCHAASGHPARRPEERDGPCDFGSLLACGSAGGPGPTTGGHGTPDGDSLAGRRLAFVARASAHLAASLDYEATLRNVARLTVPSLADWCVVDTLDEDGSVRLLAVAHIDPSHEELARELRRRYPLDPHARYGLRRVLDTGQPELYPEVQPTWRRAAARDAEHLRLMDALDARSTLCVPLRARGQTLGAITLICAGSGRRYGPSDVAVAQDLADRCALALDNARLYGQVQETLRTRETFLTALAHDLKSPLTASLGYAQLLQRAAGKAEATGAGRRLGEWAAIVEENTARAVALLDELVDIARLEAGQSLTLERQPTDLVALAEREVAARRRGARRHRITLDTAEPALVGAWDPARIARVLDNLLDNATKFSPDGGKIAVRVAREGASAVLTISDEGLGIPEADLPHIFERFRRGSNVEGQIPGSGIGLAGARQVVEQHGGRISVTSREGGGSTFVVRLPLA
jgi:signal transduction histidine kinase